MAATRSKVLRLYKSMMTEASKFVDFNYRSYAVRRIRDGFKASAHITDEAVILQKIKYGQENLNIIKRQATIGHLFDINQKLSVEVNKDFGR